MARLLGVGAFGIYALVIAWTTLLSTPAMLGFERLLVRELAGHESRDDWPAIRGMLRLAQRVTLTLAILLGAGLALIGVLLGDPDGLGAPVAFIAGAAIVPLTVLVNLRQSALQGLHRVALSFVPETLVRPGLLVLLAGGALVVGLAPQAALVGVGVMVAATAVAAVVSIVLLRRFLGERRHGPATAPRDWLRPALTLAYLATIAALAGQADLVLVGLLRSPEEAGAYAVAVRGSIIVGIPLIVINFDRRAGLRAPLDAQGAAAPPADGDAERQDRAGADGATGGGLRAVRVVVPGAVRPGLRGRRGAAGDPSVGRILATALGPTGILLAMTGQERPAAVAVTAGATMEIVMVLLLLPSFGLSGAAVGSAAALVAGNASQAAIVRRRLGLGATALGI